VRELAEVDAFGDDPPVAGAERPGEADRAVMRVDAARQQDACARHLRLESADVCEQRVAPLDACGRIRVDAAVGPRTLERAPARPPRPARSTPRRTRPRSPRRRPSRPSRLAAPSLSTPPPAVVGSSSRLALVPHLSAWRLLGERELDRTWPQPQSSIRLVAFT